MELWSVARFDLGLQKSEFLRITPREFTALCKRKELADERLDFRSAQICAALYNVHRGKNTKEYKPEQFMPQKRKGGRGRKQQTWQEQLEMAKQITAVFGGSVSKKS